MLIKKTFSGQRFRAMLMTASISVCAEIANVFVDKIVAAQFLGEKALASISFFSPLFSFIFFLNALVAVGSLACYSIELGRMNRDRANGFFGQSILLSFLVGTLMVILFAFGKVIMFRFMNVDPELLQYVNEFYIWFLGIAFFMPFCNVLQEMILPMAIRESAMRLTLCFLAGTSCFRACSAPVWACRALRLEHCFLWC